MYRFNWNTHPKGRVCKPLPSRAADLHSLFFQYQYHPLWRFFKNKIYLKSSHGLKAISGTLLIIVNSYNLDLIAISLRLIKMSINRTGCGLK